MQVVLDACVPARFATWLPGHQVSTLSGLLGASDLDDGPLLERLKDRCQALITVDKNIPFQQNVSHLTYGIVIIRARSNRLEHLIPLAPGTLSALADLRPGQVLYVGV